MRSFKPVHKRSMSEEAISRNYLMDDLTPKAKDPQDNTPIFEMEIENLDAMIEEPIILKNIADNNINTLNEVTPLVQNSKLNNNNLRITNPKQQKPTKTVNKKKSPSKKPIDKKATLSTDNLKDSEYKSIEKIKSDMNKEVLKTLISVPADNKKNLDENNSNKTKNSVRNKPKPILTKDKKDEIIECVVKKIEKEECLNAFEILTATKLPQKSSKISKESKQPQLEKEKQENQISEQNQEKYQTSKQQKHLNKTQEVRNIKSKDKSSLEKPKPQSKKIEEVKDRGIEKSRRGDTFFRNKAVKSPLLNVVLEKEETNACALPEDKECRIVLLDVRHLGISNLTMDHENKVIEGVVKPSISGANNIENEDLESLSRKFLKKISKELQKYYSQETLKAEKTAKLMEERIRKALQSDPEMIGNSFKVNYTAKIIELIKKITEKELHISVFVRKEEPEFENKVKIDEHN